MCVCPAMCAMLGKLAPEYYWGKGLVTTSLTPVYLENMVRVAVRQKLLSRMYAAATTIMLLKAF